MTWIRRSAGMVLVVLLLAAANLPGPAAAHTSPTVEGQAGVTVLGVERDRRFGRAWLLARLSGAGHLRTVSNRLKAFAPPGEYEAGFVRIPLIPKLPIAKLLRSRGRATVTVTIYFGPPGAEGVVVRRTVTLLRTLPRRPTNAVH